MGAYRDESDSAVTNRGPELSDTHASKNNCKRNGYTLTVSVNNLVNMHTKRALIRKETDLDKHTQLMKIIIFVS